MNTVMQNILAAERQAELYHQWCQHQDLAAFAKKHRCGRCWDPVLVVKKEDGYKLTCPNCGEGFGFVSEKYVDRRIGESYLEYRKAKAALEYAVDWLQLPSGRSTQQILKELGVE